MDAVATAKLALDASGMDRGLKQAHKPSKIRQDSRHNSGRWICV